jgi:hypothetical protein
MIERLSSALFLLAATLAVTGLPTVALAAEQEEAEYLCVKDLKAPHEGQSMACYTDNGCSYVESIGGEPLRDYDRESVPFALGREKIEGIVTSSAGIMKKIAEFGYKCEKLYE